MVLERSKDDAFKAMKAVVGPRGWTDDPSRLAPHLVDWRKNKRGMARLMLLPGSPEALSRIVLIAADHRIGLVPQGGNTSLCGGSVPEPQGDAVLVSSARMQQVRHVDASDFSLVAEAGVTLSQVHASADAAGRLFPLSIAAKGSATIGGLISTNAGGVQVLRYGTMRALVLGIEAVLPDGSIFNGLSALRKDNTGYDIKQLLIGAEGTLGFVTAATLKLVPRPAQIATALVGLRNPAAALALLSRLREATGDQVDSFELMPRVALDLVLAHVPSSRDPLADRHEWYVLVEATSARRGEFIDTILTEELTAAIAADEIEGAVIAASEAQRQALWRLRETLPEAERIDGGAVKHDIAVPIGAMPRFLLEATQTVEARWPGARVLAFGHLGDGNVHFNVRPPANAPTADFLDRHGAAINACVYDMVAAYGGSISAEHGIGTLKREELARRADPAKLAVMRAVKHALDPYGILNPGKLL